jgi:thioredoxin-related protein
MPKRLSNKFILMTVFIAISFLLTIGCGEKSDKTAANSQEINFVTDYDSALIIAQQKGQNTLFDFYTDWCTWCKTLDTVTYVDSAVIEYSKKMVFAKIDAEKDTMITNKYSIQGFPTIVLTNADGSEIDRIGGYLEPKEFLETVDNYLNDIGTLKDYLRKADTNATTEVNYVLAEKYGDRGMNMEAKSYYDKVIKADPKHEDTLTSAAMLSIGSLYLRDKEFEKSFVQFKKVMKIFEGSETAADAELWLGYAYRKRGNEGDTTDAIKVYVDFLKNHPDSPDTSHAIKMIDRLKNPPPPKEEGK